MHELLHILWHGTLDALKILPFLLLTYLLMELLEHKAGDGVRKAVTKAGRAGPLIGGGLGLVPQCGFSSAAAGLFAGRVVTPGTLIAVFLSTSDEMLPVFLGAGVGVTKTLTVLGIKLAIAVAVGFLLDFLMRSHIKEMHVEELCQDEHCHCEQGIWRSALHHTLHVFLFVWLISVALCAAFELLGEARIGELLNAVPVLSVLLCALIGLVPNCAASVAIATLWTHGVISGGAMLAGLLTGAGAGLLVLYRTNHRPKQNLALTALLFGVGLLFGLLFELTGLAAAMGL